MNRSSPSLFGMLGQRKMAALLLLGFSSGLPLFLTSRTLQAWMTVEGLDLGTIGFAALLALPYSFKFLWAPFFDAYLPPLLGSRRGWLIVVQLCLMVSIAAMSLQNPRTGLLLLAANALLIAFFSASQDIVVDGYSVEVVEDRELGAGASLKVLGYRIALILTGGVALILADRMPWPMVYLLLSLLMLIGIAASLFAPEPVVREGKPSTLDTAVVQPFREFFQRAGAPTAILLLLFIVLYSYADRLVQITATPFLLLQGYTQTDIGAIQGVLGLGATIVGVIAGGALISKLSINRSLWVMSVLQIASNLAYYWLAVTPRNLSNLTVAIIVENFCGGLVTAGFVAFMMSLCTRQFSVTQYALLSSFMGVARDFLSAPAGKLAESTGWPAFFLITIAAGIPALLLLPYLAPWNRDLPRGAAVHTGEVADATA